MSNETLPPTPQVEAQPDAQRVDPSSSLDPSLQDVKELLLGLNEKNDFGAQMQDKLEEQLGDKRGGTGAWDFSGSYDATTAHTQILKDHSIDSGSLNPTSLPDRDYLKGFTDEDWDDVRQSEYPFIEVWSKSGRNQLLAEVARKEHAQQWGAKELGPQFEADRDRDEATLRSLPLLHSTTLEGLEGAIEHGTFVSNRALHEQGVDVTGQGDEKTGFTTAEDRELGLDQYVFADFGRPHYLRQVAPQAEAVVVFAPEAMKTEGTFLTEKDLLDCRRPNGDIDYEAYMQSASTPEDFYDIALPTIYMTESRTTYRESPKGMDSKLPMTLKWFMNGENSDQNDALGNPRFSTWEVKMPEVSTQHIDRIIFRDPTKLESFKAKYGDRFTCMLEPDIKGHPEVLGTDERLKQHLDSVESQPSPV